MLQCPPVLRAAVRVAIAETESAVALLDQQPLHCIEEVCAVVHLHWICSSSSIWLRCDRQTVARIGRRRADLHDMNLRSIHHTCSWIRFTFWHDTFLS